MRKAHWEGVYKTQAPKEVSWSPSQSGIGVPQFNNEAEQIF